MSLTKRSGEKSLSNDRTDGLLETSRQRLLRLIGVILFSVGLWVGMVVVGGAIYADFEAMLSNISVNSDQVIRPISCPILMFVDETGDVSSVIRNSTELPLNSVVQMQIQQGYLSYSIGNKERLELPAHESKRFDWTIIADQAASGLMLVKVMSLASGDATHKGSCGIIVLNIPAKLGGYQLYLVLSALSFLLMLIGLRLWQIFGRFAPGRYIETTQAFVGLMVVVLLGMLFTLVGIWEISAVFFYISLLMVGVIVPHLMISRQRGS